MTTAPEKTIAPETTTAGERSLPKPEFTDAEAGAKEFPDSTSRSFNYYTPAKRKQSHYEDANIQPLHGSLRIPPWGGGP